jgi:poly(A) polymerase
VNVIPRIIARSEHSISRSNIDKGVLDILYTLSRSGYEAYLVGGGLRDMLLGLEPKDFDIVTNATPDQIKIVFRSRCRIIGKRFRLAHVHVGDKVIEVATFRAQSDERGDRLIDESGMLRRDNIYGTRDEDVWRRDFTVNALYYNIQDFSLIDYVGALDDLYAGNLRLIGDPSTRYREDPVRMIRAVRFACKLGLQLPKETAEPLPLLAHLLAETAPARLYEEVLKLFHGGQAACVFETLRQHGLLGGLFDQTEYCLQQPSSWSAAVIPLGLAQTDNRVSSAKGLNPAFLFALMLWEPLWMALEADEQSLVHIDELLKAASQVLNEQSERTSLARPVMQQVKEIWATQLPLVTKKDKAERIMALPRFRAAFDFLVLRAAAAPNLQETVDFWTKIQITHPHWLVESSFTQEVSQEADAHQLTDSHQQAEPKRRRRYRQR